MELKVRKATDRGRGDHDWLQTRFTFSFAGYFDPEHMGFRALRVINEDRVAPARGFGEHPHRDMEILTVVLAGAVEHRDSMGNRGLVRPGEVQRMTAGTGVRHSELNPSDDEELHLYQIWILPEREGLEPSYEQRAFPDDERRGRLRTVASRDGRDGSLTVHQNVSVYSALLADGDSVTHPLADGRHAWLQVTRGEVELADRVLGTGDGAAVSDASELTATARGGAEILLFDLA